MSDQATRLRMLAANARFQTAMNETAELCRAKTIAITSGKGGVGKSNIALNLAIAFSNRGHKVLLMDADINLANLDVLMGLTPRYTLHDVIQGTKVLSEIIVTGAGGIDLLPANSGAVDLWNINTTTMAPIFLQLAELEGLYDYILVDTAAGIAPYVIDFVVSAQEVLVVTHSEPTAMMDAYAVIKLASQQLSRMGRESARIRVVLNRVTHRVEARETFNKMNKAVSHFLGFTIEPAGIVLADNHVSLAVKRRIPLISAYPNCPASRCIQGLAGRFVPQGENAFTGEKKHGLFFHKLWNSRFDSRL